MGMVDEEKGSSGNLTLVGRAGMFSRFTMDSPLESVATSRTSPTTVAAVAERGRILSAGEAGGGMNI